jgi:DNA repair ATPase RecN
VRKQEDENLANEEIQRAIEFIVQQQAQYAARLERDEVRLASLEESFKMLVELARGADERQDTMEETMATLSNTMNDLVQTTITLKESQHQAEAILTEFARASNDRLVTVERTMTTLSQTMNELAQSMPKLSESQNKTDASLAELARGADARANQYAATFERDESRLARYEESFNMLVQLPHKHE